MFSLIQDSMLPGRLYYRVLNIDENDPNTLKYKTSQKLSPKHAACGAVQSPYPIYRHEKAGLSKQPPLRAARDPCLARGRSQFPAPAPAEGFFSHPPFLPPQGIFRTKNHESVPRVIHV